MSCGLGLRKVPKGLSREVPQNFGVFILEWVGNMNIRTSIPVRLAYLMTLFFTPSVLQSQQNSSNIRQRILASEEPDQMLVMRTRNFILRNLESGNINEAHEAYNYAVDKLESENTKPFRIVEKFLLGYWFGKYEIIYHADSIENSVDATGGNFFLPSRDYLYPQRDKLALELRIISKKHKSELLQRVASLVNHKEKQDFLVLFLDWLTFDAIESEISAEQAQDYLENDLTPRAEEFLASYKESRFRPFVKQHFRYVYVLNDWGFGYFIGLGSLGPKGTAEQYLKPEVTLGMGIDLSWRSMLMSLGFDIGVPVAIRKPFIYEGKAWNTDLRHNYFAFYAAPGWVLEDSKMFRFSPHVGIGAIHIAVAEADQGKPGGDVSMTQGAILYGMSCDIKLALIDSFFRENSHSYSGVRVNLDYFQFLGNNPIMSGGMLRFNIAWIGFGRSILRDI